MNSSVFHLVTARSPGLVADAEIVASILKDSCQTVSYQLAKRNLYLPHQRLFIKARRLFQSNQSFGIFFEKIYGSWVDCFDKIFLIPNQEWITEETINNLKTCHEIWCKTRYAENIFNSKGLKVKYIGFSSIDRYVPNVQKKYDRILHVQGKSQQKGTLDILDVWAQQPAWPTLLVITRYNELKKFSCHNIQIISEFLSDFDLEYLMNLHGIHVCTSETEGFGHSICEALSTKAVVMTTNAPPMNELVDPRYGFLINNGEVISRGFSEWFKFDKVHFEQTFNRVLILSDQDKRAMGELARAAYLRKRDEFSANLKALVAGS